MSGPKLNEIAQRIAAHLMRFEADKEINKRGINGLSPYFNAGAVYFGGARVAVRYVSFQGYSNLRKADALKYLEMLDDGFVGRHYEALRKAGLRP